MRNRFFSAFYLFMTIAAVAYANADVNANDPAPARDSRTFEFSYSLLAAEFPSDAQIDIYIPLPAKNAGQRVLTETFKGSIAGELGSEPTFSNRFYHIRRVPGDSTPIQAELTWTVQRSMVNAGDDMRIGEAQRRQFLAPNALVPVGDPMLDPIRAEIRAMRVDDSPAATARAIYDWVVDNVEYKKVGIGWGNGDTYWACSERYGNCTDFHALFVSLARSEGIPARFEIGFPVPTDRQSGDIGGYHCWVQFYLPERGWIPIDASEAAKHPEKRDLYYGTHPADRIHFTTGRDIVVSEVSASAPLNYFIYPYVEVNGKPWHGKLETRFSFQAL